MGVMQFCCPRCNGAMVIPDSIAGQLITCAHCLERVNVTVEAGIETAGDTVNPRADPSGEESPAVSQPERRQTGLLDIRPREEAADQQVAAARFRKNIIFWVVGTLILAIVAIVLQMTSR